MLRSFVDQSDLDFDTRCRLLEIANITENEKEDYRKQFTFSSNVSLNCLALAEYIQSYVENNGPHTENFINGLYTYLEKINKEIEKIKQRPDDLLIEKIKNIIDRAK